MSKKEEDAFETLMRLKIENEKWGVYIYDCARCSNFLMLHQAKCLTCGDVNAFYSPSTSVNSEVEKKIIQ